MTIARDISSHTARAHTSYLSWAPRTAPCKKFCLVAWYKKFQIEPAKLHILNFFFLRVLHSFWVQKSGIQKSCLCKRNDKYEVCKGFTCGSCHRLQGGAPLVHAHDERVEVVPHIVRREMENLVDRHLLSEECVQHGDRLFTLVRKKQINYAKHELLALCISQAVFAIYGNSISLTQLSALLNCHLNEVFLRRKHLKLCQIFPIFFYPIPYTTPSFGISLLSLTPKKEDLLKHKIHQLMLNSKFNFSWGAAIYCVIKQNNLCSDNQLLNFVSSYPLKGDLVKCRTLLKQDHMYMI